MRVGCSRRERVALGHAPLVELGANQPAFRNWIAIVAPAGDREHHQAGGVAELDGVGVVRERRGVGVHEQEVQRPRRRGGKK